MKKFLLALLLISSTTFAQQVAQSFTLDGSLSVDPEGKPMTYQWRLVSGPGTVTITNAGQKIATVSGVLKAGKYIFELEVTDDKGLKSTDRTEVNVVPNPDFPPVVNSGNDQSVQLPSPKFTLTGTATDINGNGTIIFIQWTQISGPNTALIKSPGVLVTDIEGFVQGVYRFRLKIGDNGGASAADTVQVTVLAANQLPAANAGSDQSITLPVSTVRIGGPDPAGAMVQWARISGNSSAVINQPNSQTTDVSGLKKGIYVFRKTTVSTQGVVGYDDVTVTVKGACFFLFRLFGFC